jgi:beta-catenin-like protein 1
MDSEIELHTAITELTAVAASPELYHVLVDNGAVKSILGMITHENTDISLAAVALIQEIIDSDTLSDIPEADIFIDTFLNEQGLELIVQNLNRLDEENEEDAQGVQQILSIIESLTDLRPSVANDICAKTHILTFLLSRLKVQKFDTNKLYCSEILSILLQTSPMNQRRICMLGEIDGLDDLLQCIAPYRKRDPESIDEQVNMLSITFK